MSPTCAYNSMYKAEYPNAFATPPRAPNRHPTDRGLKPDDQRGGDVSAVHKTSRSFTRPSHILHTSFTPSQIPEYPVLEWV